jgi:NADH-quinone oxidoreductase subunit C
MGPEDVGARLVELIPGATAGVSGSGAHASATVDVPSEGWANAARAARDELGCDFFDWLSAVDELEGEFTVVTHLWSTSGRHGVLLRTRLASPELSLESLTSVYPGAAWHERETYEMFGIGFPGELAPLLLPPEFEGHPLRKSFVLASRVAKAWPGAREPGESHDPKAPKRTTMRPPGVPAPGEWGPASSPD